MVARITNIEFFILLLGEFFRATCVRVVKQPSLDRIITPYTSRGTIFRGPLSLIKKCSSIGILRPLDHMNVNPMLTFVAIACLVETGWSALGEQKWFLYEYDNGMLNILEEVEPIRRVLPDGNVEWQDDGDEICSIYCKKYNSRGTKETFVKPEWLRYIDIGKNYYEVPSVHA